MISIILLSARRPPAAAVVVAKDPVGAAQVCRITASSCRACLWQKERAASCNDEITPSCKVVGGPEQDAAHR